MSKIHILEPQVVNQIAAGEVVERPASIVKEFVENSIDAGAMEIVIEVMKGGQDLIRITDNGCGMDEEDAKMALLKHATSKIKETSDLEHLMTLGFRGEALSSIAAVSLMTLRTKTAEAVAGIELQIEGGEVKKISAAGCPAGTQISVKSLFFNTPARRKFLKSVSTEFSHIVNTVSNFGLCYPEIAFKLFHNERVIIDLAATENRLERIKALLGKDQAENWVAVYCAHKDVQIEGFVGKPDSARNDRNGQYLFVNGREIKNSYVAHSVRAAYDSYLPERKFPIFVLFLKINPMLADFNIHPRKLEVKFLKQQELYYLIKESVRKALETVSLTPTWKYMPEQKQEEPFLVEDRSSLAYGKTNKMSKVLEAQQPFKRSTFVSEANFDAALAFNKELQESLKLGEEVLDQERFHQGIRPRAQIAQSYIVAESAEGLVIIDQHAAHERIMFMKLKDNILREQKLKQTLLSPVQLELAHQEVLILEENRAILQEMGFELEFFGGNSLAICSVPAFLNQSDWGEILKGVLADLIEGRPVSGVNEAADKILHYVACRSAVKFGRALTVAEQEALIVELSQAEMKYTCPHGRPTMLKMSFSELEKRFGRR